MTKRFQAILPALMILAALALPAGTVHADKYRNTIEVFKKAEATLPFFENAYGYAVFPTVGKAGIGMARVGSSGITAAAIMGMPSFSAHSG